VPGRSLQARVDAQGPLTVEETLRIGVQAASGLAAAHEQGLVHRDVKPSNILLEEAVDRAILTDFGLARAIDDASLTHTGVLAGTPHYMSPEQATGDAIDHRSDLFSLGAVLYFMATGHPPFRADGALAVLHRICRDRQRPAWQSNKDVPDELSDLIDRLLEKKPSRRPASAAEVRDRLAAILSRVQQFGPGRRRFGILRTRRGRRRVFATVGATLLVGVVAAVAYRVTSSSSPATDSPPPPNPAELAQAVADVAERDEAFVDQLQSAISALERAEQETISTLPGDAAWQAEVEAIQRKLTELEADLGLAP